MLSRDPVRTRRALLDAAARAVAEHGVTVSLEVVAREAGVSKGGLLHHFPSRDALFAGLVHEWIDRFDAAVERHVDPADDRPGRLLRAYVRASFDDLDIDERVWRDPAMVGMLVTNPAVVQRAALTDRRWRAALADDGLHPQRVELVTRTLDGLLLGDLIGASEPDPGLRDLLLALSEDTGPLV